MAGLLPILIIAFIIVLSIYNNTVGLISFLSVRILIPEIVRLNDNLSLNTGVILVITIIFFVKALMLNQRIYFNRKFYIYIASILLYSAITLPLSNYGSLSGQYGMLLQFFVTDIIPPILFVTFINTEKQLRVVLNAYIVITYIVCVYGILCYFLGSNPYVSFLKELYSNSVMPNGSDVAWYGNSSSSTFIANNQFGCYLIFSIPFFSVIYNKCKRELTNRNRLKFIVLFILLIICVILSKKRTAVVTLVAFGIAWFVSGNIQKHLKLFGLLLIPISIMLVVIFTVPTFESFKNIVLTSIFFWNDKYYSTITQNNGGSNMALRTRQIWYPFIEIKKNLLLGHGTEWCAWYTRKYTLHPILYGFETILSSAICEFGILGYGVYFYIYSWLYKFSTADAKDKKYEKIFMVTIIIGAIGTGANYWYLLFILIILLHKINCSSYKENNKRIEEACL